MGWTINIDRAVGERARIEHENTGNSVNPVLYGVVFADDAFRAATQAPPLTVWRQGGAEEAGTLVADINPDWEPWILARMSEGWQFQEQIVGSTFFFRAVDPSGFQRGGVVSVYLGNDNQFWGAAMIAVTVVTMGVASWAAAGGAVAGSETAALEAAAYGEGASGYATESVVESVVAESTVETGTSTMSYSDFIDPYQFSSGESYPISTDNAVTNFGQGTFDPSTGFESVAEQNLSNAPAQAAETTLGTGSTPEALGDFGVQDYTYSPDVSAPAGSPVSAAPSGPDLVPTIGSSAIGTVRTASDTIRGLGTLYGAIAGVSGGSLAANQREPVSTTSTRNQLQANPSSPAASQNTPWVMIASIAALLIGFVVLTKTKVA